MGYSAEFRQAAVRKLLEPGSRGLKPLALELGVMPHTLRKWRDGYVGGETMTSGKSAHHWTAEQKLQAVMETAGMNEEAVGAFCRSHGVYSEQLDLWRQQCLAGMRKGPKTDPEKKGYQQEIQTLKRELHRKEKALAEAAALLVLKKKAHAFWKEMDSGDGEGH